MQRSLTHLRHPALRASAAARAALPRCAPAAAFSSGPAASSSSSSSSGPSGSPHGNGPLPTAAGRRSFLARRSVRMGVGVLAVGGAGVAYMSSKAARNAEKPKPPPFNLDDHRGYGSLEGFLHGQDIVLYQYEVCPFCNKVRAFLDYAGIRYRTVEVNPLTKAEKKVTPELEACREVPVLTINGTVLTDSTSIIRNVNEIMNLYRAPEQQHVIGAEEMASLDFVDKRIVILTAPNLYRSLGESLDSFDYIGRNSQLAASTGPVLRWANKYVGAMAMRALTKYKLNKKYNITDARQMMYQAIKEWIDGNAGRPFRGGASPNLADLTCFGVFRALQGYQTGRDVMNPAHTSQQFVDWYKAMEKEVESRAEAAKQKA